MSSSRVPLAPAVLALCLGVSLGLGWLVATPGRAVAAGWASEPVVSSAAGRQLCADFLFVGVRGSGEPSGYGDTIKGVRDGLRSRWKREGTVRQVWLDYPAVAPQTLGEVAFESLLFDQPMPSTKYFDSAETGARALEKVVEDSQTRCPRERVILAGFSQGAQVITRTLGRTRPGSKLVGAILLGNPSHYPGQNVRELGGTAPDTAIGMGAFLSVLRDIAASAPSRQAAVERMLAVTFDVHEGKIDKPVVQRAMKVINAEIPPESYPVTFSVCAAGDMVCDSSGPMGQLLVQASTMQEEIDRTRPVHLGYTGDMLATTLDEVARAINTAPVISAAPTPVEGRPLAPDPLPGRPTWSVLAGVGLGAGILGFIVGAVVGRANGRASAARSHRRRRQRATEDGALGPDD